MRLRNILTQRRYGIIQVLSSIFFLHLKYCSNKLKNLLNNRKNILLKGKSKIGIHHSASLLLDNSKIIIHDGVLKIGIDFGYFDGGIYDPLKDSCRIHLKNSTLTIYGNVSLYPGVIINAFNANITIRNGTIINGGSQLIAKKNIEIGEHCLIAQDVIIRDNDGHKLFISDNPMDECREVHIKNHCWIGQRVNILKGVTLENNVIIAAGAIVSRSIKEGSLAAGIPARVIKENVAWQA